MNKKWELRQLLRNRSITLEQWRGLWRQVGAKSGVLDDMTRTQLIMLKALVEKLPPYRGAA